MNICEVCHKKVESFFCPSCGNILEMPQVFEGNPVLEEKLSGYLKQLVKRSEKGRMQILESGKLDSISNQVIRQCFERIAVLQTLCQSAETTKYFEAGGESLFAKMNVFGKSCMSNVCQIAVVGTIKAGKSTLMNAFLGKNIASIDPCPETASLTKFRFSPGKDYVKVVFMDKNEWECLWKSVEKAVDNGNKDFTKLYEELNAEQFKGKCVGKESLYFEPTTIDELRNVVAQFSSARFPEHFFVKEVEIGLKDFNIPANVEFVDTPGLDDPIDYRTDITKDYLRSANVVLICYKATEPTPTISSLKTIGEIFACLRYNKSRIYILGTQFDAINRVGDPMEFWNEYTRKQLIKYLSEKSYFGDKKLAGQQVLPMSAYAYSLAMELKENPDNYKKHKDEIKYIVERFLPPVDLDDLVEQYGEEKANQLAIRLTPKNRFFDNIETIIEACNIPNAKKLIFEGPVMKAEDIIVEKIKSEYTAIRQKIKENATDAKKMQERAVVIGLSADAKNKIEELEKVLARKQADYNEDKKELLALLQSVQKETTKLVISLKKE